MKRVCVAGPSICHNRTSYAVRRLWSVERVSDFGCHRHGRNPAWRHHPWRRQWKPFTRSSDFIL